MPYFVAVKENGTCICQCKGFKTASLCSHSQAVRCGSHCETGPVPFSQWSKHHSSSVNVSTKKCGEKAWPEATYLPNKNESIENKQRYQLKWLDKTTARVCYGCGGKLWPWFKCSPSSIWHPSDNQTISLLVRQIHKKQEATHCHVNPVCILAKNSEFQALLLKIGKGCSIVTRTFLSSLWTLPFCKPGLARTQETFVKIMKTPWKT